MAIAQITPRDLKTALASATPPHLIDVREEDERAESHIGGEFIPMGQILLRINEIPRDKQVVIYCRSGGRSQHVIDQLQKAHGFTNLINLQGGILACVDQFDLNRSK